MTSKAIPLGKNPLVNVVPYLIDAPDGTAPKPLVIVCPGGGFLGCSSNEGEPVARMLNRAGYHAAVLTYTNATTAPGVDAYPQALFDLSDTVCLVRSRAQEWCVDQDRIAILGFSAGGWLCAMYENLWDTPLFDGHGTADDRQPNAAVLCYPLVDYRNNGMIRSDDVSLDAVLGEGDRVRMEAFQAAVNRALVGERVIDDELTAAITPLFHIGPSTPPTFVWTTFGDGLLEPAQSLAYAQALHEANIPSELHVFQEGFHGLSLADETTAHKPADVNPHVAHWAELACEWLGLTFGC